MCNLVSGCFLGPLMAISLHLLWFLVVFWLVEGIGFGAIESLGIRGIAYMGHWRRRSPLELFVVPNLAQRSMHNDAILVLSHVDSNNWDTNVLLKPYSDRSLPGPQPCKSSFICSPLSWQIATLQFSICHDQFGIRSNKGTSTRSGRHCTWIYYDTLHID